jgi:hypothetical protein
VTSHDQPQFTALAEARSVVERHFPGIWPSVEVCLSAVCTLLLKDTTDVSTVIQVGPPASSKTLTLNFLDQKHWLFYWSDKFTPKSFVSHYAGVSPQSLSGVDLLPKIKHRVLVTPELAPLLRGRKDELTEAFAVITRVLDGQGLMTDSGVHGKRGYSGDYNFVWLGATTPLPPITWEVMAQLGSRFFFLPVGGEEVSDEALDKALRDPIGNQKRISECREAVMALVEARFPNESIVRAVEWDRNATPSELSEALGRLARLLSRLRGVVPVVGRSKGNSPEYGLPVVEQPHRAVQVLFNIARGHALLFGRQILTAADVARVVPLALGSCPDSRRQLMAALLEHGTLSALDGADVLGVSRETGRRYLAELQVLGLVTSTVHQGREFFTLSERWQWFRSEEFRTLAATDPWEEVSL